MGLFDALRRLVGADGPGEGRTAEELAARLGTTADVLRAFRPAYREVPIPKASGAFRRLLVPEDETKALQRRILRKLLDRLPVHPAAHGFERGRSTATAAAPHVGRAVVMRLDIAEFFATTRPAAVEAMLCAVGWNRDASRLLARLAMHRNGLPQGAPTSPRLANLVNWPLDQRMAGLAAKLGARYTRYADDLVLSFDVDEPLRIHRAIRVAKAILAKRGYAMHHGPKLRIRRAHQQQRVLGLVANARLALDRSTRRWLRAVEHHARTGRPVTLDATQLAGWRAYAGAIERAERARGL